MEIPINILYKEAQSEVIKLVNTLIQQLPLYDVEAILKNVLNEVHEAVENAYRESREAYQAALMAEQQTKITDTSKGEE